MTDTSTTVSAQQLQSIIERIENLEEEKKGISDDIKDVYSEAKGNGFAPNIIRQLVKLRKMASADRQEQEALLEMYMSALKMI